LVFFVLMKKVNRKYYLDIQKALMINKKLKEILFISANLIVCIKKKKNSRNDDQGIFVC